MKIRRHSIPARARQMQRTVNFCYSGSSSKKQILEQNQIFKRVNRYPCTFFKNSTPKKIKSFLNYFLQNGKKKVSQGKTPRKKDKIKFLKKVNGYPFTFLKIKKIKRIILQNGKEKKCLKVKPLEKKCLKVKPLNKKSRELFYKSI